MSSTARTFSRLIVGAVAAVAVVIPTAGSAQALSTSATVSHGTHHAKKHHAKHHAKRHHHKRHHHKKHHAKRAHSASGSSVVRIGLSKVGTPYRYGATGPRAFDCSGFTAWAFSKVGKRLPHNSAAQYRKVRHISRGAAHAGDLVFFDHGGRVYHVGILASKGRVLHAPYTGVRVRTERIWSSSVRYGRA